MQHSISYFYRFALDMLKLVDSHVLVVKKFTYTFWTRKPEARC